MNDSHSVKNSNLEFHHGTEQTWRPVEKYQKCFIVDFGNKNSIIKHYKHLQFVENSIIKHFR